MFCRGTEPQWAWLISLSLPIIPNWDVAYLTIPHSKSFSNISFNGHQFRVCYKSDFRIAEEKRGKIISGIVRGVLFATCTYQALSPTISVAVHMHRAGNGTEEWSRETQFKHDAEILSPDVEYRVYHLCESWELIWEIINCHHRELLYWGQVTESIYKVSSHRGALFSRCYSRCLEQYSSTALLEYLILCFNSSISSSLHWSGIQVPMTCLYRDRYFRYVHLKTRNEVFVLLWSTLEHATTSTLYTYTCNK